MVDNLALSQSWYVIVNGGTMREHFMWIGCRSRRSANINDA